MRNFSSQSFTWTVILLSFLLASCSEDDNPADGGNNAFTPPGMHLIQAKNAGFQMGSNRGQANEAPVHSVSFTHNFWMDTTEVTQGGYDALMRSAYAGYTTPEWHAPYGVGSRYPAYEVTWSDAALYCNARSKRDGFDTVYTYTAVNGVPGNGCELAGVVIDYSKNGYRLPTEAEWEFACRAGSTADFLWGRQYDPYPATPADTAEINSYAVWDANSRQLGVDDAAYGIHQAASKRPNAYGLYDMAGNVYEWCNDWYGDYGDSAAVNPTGPATGEWHLLRGGSWGSQADYLRSANRSWWGGIPDYEYYFIGFRAALPVD